MKKLILAEKPSVGKDIARVLGCKSGGNGYLENSSYVVTWAMGHLVTLADPEQYNPKYKSWNLNDLPIMPKELKFTVIGKTAKQFNVVKDLLQKSGVGEVVIATDAGREGELVARLILLKCGNKLPVKRLWISSVTDKAIKEGFARLKDGRDYIALYHSALARMEADWLVGVNATRCVTSKHNSQLSLGRVQTPTLAIIEGREKEIREFKPIPYYTITASAGLRQGSFTLTLRKSNESRIFNKSEAEKIYDTLKDMHNGAVISVRETEKKVYPPALYDLTELQRDANRLFGYSPKETLNIMQKLYEQHKALTYPRTDSRYLTSDIVATIPERLRACAVGQYAKLCAKLSQTKIKAAPHFVDDKKVSDHHAIIPTEESADLSAMSSSERKIYDLVVSRFLSVFYPPYIYKQTELEVKIGNETFNAKGHTPVQLGFREIFTSSSNDETEDTKEQNFPLLKQGDKINIKGISINEGRTKPPEPFNESTLLSAMENPGKYVSDKSIAKTLGETGGLGTVATRADIIEKLFASFVIEKKGKEIHTTSKGRQLLRLAPSDLKSPELTGKWEQQLSLIASGKLNKDVFLKDIREYAYHITDEIKRSEAVFAHDNLSGTKCPECGKLMLAVNGKKGKMLVCQDRECGTRKTVSISIRSRCPRCHKMLELVGEGEGRKIVCTCGFKESYENFEKRKKQERNVPSKADLQKYLREQNNSAEQKYNPLADALKDFKF